VRAQIRSLRKILTQQAVCVFIRAALPRAARITKIDFDTRIQPQLGMLRHFSALVPSQRATQLLRQLDDCSRDGIADSFGAMPCECGSVLDAGLTAVALHARQMNKERETRRPLYQCADRRTAQPQDEIAFPMTGYGAVCSFSGALADHDCGGHEGLSAFASALPWHAKRAPGAQAGGQLAAQRASALHVKCLVDGFGADAHRFVVWKIVR
jgi:hypothetical protein